MRCRPWLTGCLVLGCQASATTPQDAGIAATTIKRWDLKAFAPREAAVPAREFRPPSSFAPLVRAVRNAVVHVNATTQDGRHNVGSGFIIHSDGLVVTNDHVLGTGQGITVRSHEGRDWPGTVVARDTATDVALLALPPGNYPTLGLGDSDLLEVGDWIVVVGSPFGLDTTVSQGIVSAKERALGRSEFDDFLQVNAHFNPGNSGGPVFDMQGRVVGVATATMVEGQGIAFAAPINLVRDMLPNLLDNGRMDRGWLGLVAREDTVDGGLRVRVAEVAEGSPAAMAGVKPQDVIVTVGGRSIEDYAALFRKVALMPPGAKVRLSLLRQGKRVDATATLVVRPSK